MRQCRRYLLLVAVASLGTLCGLGSSLHADEESLSVAEFERLHKELQVPANEAWREVPWKLSVLEAQKQAAAEKKPVFMLVRSGHPLGCV